MSNLIYLISKPKAIIALVTWPKFSFTSFRIVNRLLDNGITPKTIIDVGSNIGQFAVASLKLFPSMKKLYAFEPLPNCINKLKSNLKGFDNVKIYPFALGSSKGKGGFNVNKNSKASSVLSLGNKHINAFPKAIEIKEINVIISTLDDVFSNTNFIFPILLKIDVQGFESEVLKGGKKLLELVDYIVIESSFDPLYNGEMTFTDLIDFMRELGFLFEKPVGWLFHPSKEKILQIDALFRKK